MRDRQVWIDAQAAREGLKRAQAKWKGNLLKMMPDVWMGPAGTPSPEHPAMALVDGLNQTVPQFCNDLGAREIRIGTKAFECIGETPPQDHPHIYLELGEQGQMLCPYCSTLFAFDSSLQKWEAVPSETLFRNTSAHDSRS